MNATRQQLDQVVTRLNTALQQAQIDGTKVRGPFLEAWRSYFRGWKANLSQFQSAVPVEKLQTRVEAWLDAFVAEGIVPDPTRPTVASGGDYDPLIWTPAAVHAELERVNGEFVQFGKELVSDPDARKIDPAKEPNPSLRRKQVAALAAQWSPLFDEWAAWYKSGPSTLWGATAAKAKEYEARAINFSQQYHQMAGGNAAMGGPSTGTFPLNVPPPDPSKHQPMTTAEKVAITLAAITAAALIVPKLLPTRSSA